MIDSVIAGTGNSRYLRTSISAGTTWEDALTMLRNGTFPIDLAGINQEGFSTLGTALNSDTLLKSAIITALGLDNAATPSDAWEAILNLIDTKSDADSVVTAVTYNASTKTLAATINGSAVTIATFDFVNATDAAAAAPVQSVAGKTGVVSLDAGDVAYSDETEYADGTVGSELAALENAVSNINSALPNKAGILRDSATGAIASFVPDYTVENLLGLSVAVEPVQSGSGDPSPDNVRPITGWDSVTVNRTGKNLLDISLANRTLVTTGEYSNTSPRAFDKPYLYVGISPNNYFSNNNINSYSVGDDYVVVNSKATGYGIGYTIKAKPGQTYHVGLNTNVTDYKIGIGFYDADGNYLSFVVVNTVANRTFTTPLNCYNMLFVFRPDQNDGDFTFEEPQLELGSTATAYEPYQGNTYTIQLGETVYGGTLDVVNGKMTVDRAKMQFTGSETWTLFQTSFFYITDGFPQIPEANMDFTTENGVVITSIPNSKMMRVYINKNSAFMDTTTNMNTILTNGIGLVYELATPFELTLTPEQISTLQGTNNVWSDAGDVTVDFAADLKTYIDNKIAAAVAALS